MTWKPTRLKYLAAVPIVNGVGEPGSFEDLAWPRYVRTTDIESPTKLRGDTFASLPPETAAGAPLERHDIVMTAAGATIGKSFRYELDAPACYAGYLVRFRPRADVDPRFISYWTQSSPYWDQIVMGKVVSTIENFSASKYQNMRLRCPDFDAQGAIADYLDTETSRIDALIAKKRRMMDLTEARRGAAIEAMIRSLADAHGEAPLKRVVQRVEVGIVVTPAAWYAPEGVLAIRGLNVSPGRITLDDVVRLSPEGHRHNRKSELRASDVVVVRTGKAGAAAVIPSELDGSNCIDLVIVRPSELLLPEFLEYVLNSDWTQKRIEERAVGSIQSHFNVGAMREVPVPHPPLHVQREAVGLLAGWADRTNGMVSRLARQIDLLIEHRHALITAAVTHELDIPGAAA